ncbi:heavy-metal-associated domain-containing protein [Mogibacterium pumilum]|uniref:ATPase P n=1 Tax=Mogibacterium pumilum TaxID=86332 RepID=A0A223ARI8_9FIRM|nr:ATPase P [Mogibacterium pumilum]ASS37555.1 ATPase P [Mogibacterium pumilum]
MIKTTVKIDGMQCNMCETHVKDIIRKKFDVKKIKASHVNGECVIVSPDEISRSELTFELGQMGYKVTDFESETYVRKGLFGF